MYFLKGLNSSASRAARSLAPDPSGQTPSSCFERGRIRPGKARPTTTVPLAQYCAQKGRRVMSKPTDERSNQEIPNSKLLHVRQVSDERLKGYDSV